MSLITFRSPTQGSVIMFGEHARQLLSALNLPVAGEILTAELPAMIARLKAAIEADKLHHPITWPDESAPDYAMKISVSENGNEGGTYHELSDSRTAFRNETAGDEA